jgi:hypothetical protein
MAALALRLDGVMVDAPPDILPYGNRLKVSWVYAERGTAQMV